MAPAGMAAFLDRILSPSDESTLHLDRLSNELADQQDKDRAAEVDDARVRLPVVSDQRGDDPLEDAAPPLQRRGRRAQRLHDGRGRFLRVRFFDVDVRLRCQNFLGRLLQLQHMVSDCEDPDGGNTQMFPRTAYLILGDILPCLLTLVAYLAWCSPAMHVV